MLPDALVMAAHFAHTRWMLDFRDRAKLEAWQQKQLKRFMRDIVPLAPRYKGCSAADLADMPTMDKGLMMGDFAAGNTRGVQLDRAFEIALRAEESRDFSPTLDDLTIGLSSGTSGNRGVFMVSKAERMRWAGILLARALPRHLLGRLLAPWQPPLRIAFFLRANSNLYTTLNSRRVVFKFFDLLKGVEPTIADLNSIQPDVLVGPPTLLRALAAETREGRLHIHPSHVISVAEVLEGGDSAMVREAFSCTPHQLYQATEGFLAYTCECGTLHLNESFVHIEPDWLDSTQTRFQPIITDFSRHTQLIVRYRLNDVLRVSDQPCSCGRAERAIAAIEGRSDEVIWLPSRNTGRAVAVYPDQIRRAMIFAGQAVHEYDVRQLGKHLQIGLLSGGDRELAAKDVAGELDKLWHSIDVESPTLGFSDWVPPKIGAKRRRVTMGKLPEGMVCTF
jgi:putative adenylate-forming enzyme